MIDEQKLVEEMEDEFCSDCVKCGGSCRFADIKEIINKQPKVGEWISVEERLPEKGRKVLLQTEGNQMAIAFLNIKSEWYVDCGEYFYTDLSAKPIAWMPLPAPYDMRKKVE